MNRTLSTLLTLSSSSWLTSAETRQASVSEGDDGGDDDDDGDDDVTAWVAAAAVVRR